jgi:hypothetical protein
MFPQALWTKLPEWRRTKVEFDPSFEAVCLFSALGIVISLLLLATVVPALGDSWTLTQLPQSTMEAQP